MEQKSAQVIALCNRKGGTGKTTQAVHLAAGLAALGKRVLLVDADSQGQCALLLGLPELNGLYELIVNNRPPERVIQGISPDTYPTRGAGGAMYLLPGSSLTYSIADQLGQSGETAILSLFRATAVFYELDVILVDTQPSITKLDAALWLAVDQFLYVTTLDRLGVAGLQSALEQFANFNPNRTAHGLPRSQVMGIIPNRVEKDTLVNRTVAEQLNDYYQHFVWSPVLERKTFQRAAQLQKLVYKYSPGGQASQDCWAISERVLGVLNAP